jgi:hypothetical protein
LLEGEAPVASMTRLEIDADPNTLSGWLGRHTLPIRVRHGRGGIRRVVLAGADGELVLGSTTHAS